MSYFLFSVNYSMKKKIRRKRQKRIPENIDFCKEFVGSIKVRGCYICGEKTICCLVFHHKDPEQKIDAISQMLNTDIELVKTEMRKCILLCRNCHAKIHSKLISCNDIPTLQID